MKHRNNDTKRRMYWLGTREYSRDNYTESQWISFVKILLKDHLKELYDNERLAMNISKIIIHSDGLVEIHDESEVILPCHF